MLIIDDTEEVVDELIASIGEANPKFKIDSCNNFEEAEAKLADFRPHLVILDLFFGPTANMDIQGKDVHSHIWNTMFRPIIVYSAQPESISIDHPLVKRIQKGKDYEQELISEIDNLRPVIEAIIEAEAHIKQKFSEALRDVAPPVYKALDREPGDLTETIVRTSRRRLAASMDHESENAKLAAWEIYLCPPIGDSSLQLGDILFEAMSTADAGSSCKANSRLEPANYLIVLTPSCDLAESGDRSPKVSKLLAARCCSVKRFKDKEFPDILKKKFKERVDSDLLTPGHKNEFIPLPKFSNEIPMMLADLRDLCLIPVDEVGKPPLNDKYIRVASIDSPYREMIAWIYSNFTGRPGIPDRDFSNWIEEIVTSTFPQEGES